MAVSRCVGEQSVHCPAPKMAPGTAPETGGETRCGSRQVCPTGCQSARTTINDCRIRRLRNWLGARTEFANTSRRSAKEHSRHAFAIADFGASGATLLRGLSEICLHISDVSNARIAQPSRIGTLEGPVLVAALAPRALLRPMGDCKRKSPSPNATQRYAATGTPRAFITSRAARSPLSTPPFRKP